MQSKMQLILLLLTCPLLSAGLSIRTPSGARDLVSSYFFVPRDNFLLSARQSPSTQVGAQLVRATRLTFLQRHSQNPARSFQLMPSNSIRTQNPKTHPKTRPKTRPKDLLNNTPHHQQGPVQSQNLATTQTLLTLRPRRPRPPQPGDGAAGVDAREAKTQVKSP